MHTNQFLFPHRLTRRDFLKTSAAAAAGLAASGVPSRADEAKAPVRVGHGQHTYEWVENWGKLPPGMKYGFGCGVVVDSRDRLFVTSRSASTC
ncbi:MAG: twin-arginine translocation signal domain-containing protein, partial [Limisphaerales bacterium]